MARTLAPPLLLLGLSLVCVPTLEAQFPGNSRNRYAVTASEEHFVLVDLGSGQTWLLVHSADGDDGPTWIPITRIDDPQEADKWRERQLDIARDQEQQERRERAERERREVMSREARRRSFGPPRGDAEREESEDRDRDRRGRDRENTDVERSDEASNPQTRLSEASKRAELLRLRARRSFLESLERQRDQLRERFGEDHPTVKSMSDQIDRLEDQLEDNDRDDERESDRDDLRRDDNREGDDQADADHQAPHLAPLLVEEERLLRTHGPQHPRVVDVRKEIETRRSLQSVESVKRKLAERDERLEQDEERARHARQSALRRIVLAKQQEVEESLAKLQKQHGDNSREVREARELLALIQAALNDLEESHE